MYGLIEHKEVINELLARYGVKFGIYKNNRFNERLFPFDTIPRIIPKNEYAKTFLEDVACVGNHCFGYGLRAHRAGRRCVRNPEG